HSNNDRLNEETASEMPAFDSLSAVMRTQWGRYLLITSWACALVPFVGWLVALSWYAATVAAGAVRSYAEQKLAHNDKALAFANSRAYPYYALFSNAFWAAAVVLCVQSGHPLSTTVGLLMTATGYMLVVAQFNAMPKNAMIASAPYTLALVWLNIDAIGDADAAVLLLAMPLLFLSVFFSLMFGHVRHLTMVKTDEERKRLFEELKEAQRAAERASEAKSMFLASMSHEIRTPMNGVLGMAELLERTNLDERQQFYADTITKSGGALMTIINDILDFSKIEAGKLDLTAEPFNLMNAVEDTAALMSPRAQEKGLELIVRFAPDITPGYVGDAGRIRQIMTNLVSNAVKFTHEGYVLINVSGEDVGGATELLIEITDTGIGLSSDKLLKIFDSFQQADSTTTRKYGGTGLGLTISKRLVEAMGGDIGVKSERGAGSTFWFRLALPKPKIAIEDSAERFVAGGRKVLVVDDIDVNCTIAAEMLSAWDMRVDTAKSGEAGLKMLRDADAARAPYDLVVTDFFMPAMDGMAFAREIKNDPALAQTPIVVLSSVDEAGLAKDFKEIGVSAYLVKPARSRILMQTIRDVLGDATPQAPAADTVIAPNAAQDAAKTSRMAACERTRALLAEDNEVNQLVVKHMLDTDAIDLVIANNGEEAVTLYRENPAFDFILMDVSMPEVDGYEATTRIRAFEHETNLPRAPIICLSAHVMSHDVERSLDAGMDDFLAKPVSQSKLAAVIEKWSPSGDKRDAGAA
ncbi:MAG: response regulator, partial [Pseudomonadota bacterium]